MIKLKFDFSQKLKYKQSLYIKGDYNPTILDTIHSFQTRYYHRNSKLWECKIDYFPIILDKLKFEDVQICGEIPKKFEKYLKLLNTYDKQDAQYYSKTKPFDHQMDSFKYALTHNKFLLGDEQGLGKAIPLNALVLTPNGYKQMNNLNVGDYVIGSNGKPTKILNKYIHDSLKMFKVTFNTGEYIECCQDHLWGYKLHADDRLKNGYKYGKYHRIADTKTLQNIIKHNRCYIPMIDPVYYPSKELHIPPYVLGILLGDGYLNRTPSITTNDADIIDILNEQLINGVFLKYPSTDNTYGYKNGDLVKWLKYYNLLNTHSDTKFIPNDYKYSSIQDRIELLQGLLDTDGYISKDGSTIEYYTTSKILANDVIALITQLGGTCGHKIKHGTYKKNGISIPCKECHVLTQIHLPKDIQPFKLQRRLARLNPKRFNPKRIINSIEYIGYYPGACIEVDAVDSLYALENCILTHNTKQALDIAVSRKSKMRHCLIVCGVNNLKWNWYKEVEIHTNEKAHILGSRINRKGKTVIGNSSERLADLKQVHDEYFIITNIETLRDKGIQAQIKKMCSEGIIGMTIIDEIHKCKNSQSKQGKAIHCCCSYYRLALTGTPLMNNPIDLYNVLKWLEVENHSLTYFKNLYCEMGGFGGYEIIGYKNLEQLESMLSKNMLRRRKEDVLNLPPKIYTDELLDMDNSQDKLYRDVTNQIIEDIDRIMLLPNPLTELIRLRQVTSNPNILSSKNITNVKYDRIFDILESTTDKVIIFSNWTQVINPLYIKLGSLGYNPAIVTGETKGPIEEMNKFQNDKSCRVILGTTPALGTGYTLTAANTVIFIDEPWSKAIKDQAEDRCYRIGTKGTVNIITLICKDTIDEKIHQIIKDKGELSDRIVDGIAVKPSDIKFLIGV